MKTFRCALFAAAAALLTLAVPLQAGDGWKTDYSAALAEAAKEKRPVLLEFTGSDWCPPCQAMKKRVFDSADFQRFAKDNLILVELDFPQAKPQSADLKKQNAELAEKYGVDGYPTIIVLSPDGKELKRQVGAVLSPDDFIQWVKEATGA